MERMALSVWRVPGCWGMKEEVEEDGGDWRDVTGGTWEAGTLSVGLAMRLLGTTCGSTYTMHVCLGLPFRGGLRIVHFENGAGHLGHRLMYM